jgi:transposase-like protein
MQTGSFDKMSGEVEADETFIGAKARNMHAGKRKVKGTGVIGKTAVMGLLERSDKKQHSRVCVKVLRSRKTHEIHASVCDVVEPGSTVYTDALASYRNLKDAEYVHGVIDHAEKYVDGRIHTNGLENFWSLLKRAIKGTYVNVEPFHLFRYLDEQSFRFNERKDCDQGRFLTAVRGIVGRGVRYLELIGAYEIDGVQPA